MITWMGCTHELSPTYKKNLSENKVTKKKYQKNKYRETKLSHKLQTFLHP